MRRLEVRRGQGTRVRHRPGPSADDDIDASADPPWHVLADGRPSSARRVDLSPRRAVTVFVGLSVLALVGILVLAGLVGSRAAREQAFLDARSTTDLLASVVVEPALEDGLLEGDPGALARLDRVVRQRVLTEGLVRVKVWGPGGRILYSDDPALIGRVFPLADGPLGVLTGTSTVTSFARAADPDESPDLTRVGLVEVYHVVHLRDGTRLMFETYTQEERIDRRTSEFLRTFGPIAIATVALVELSQLTLIHGLVRRLRAARHRSERSLRRVIRASTCERSRIAADVHDNIVQGLAGASFVVAGAADVVDRRGDSALADELRAAAGALRTSIRGLRSFLLEIYPPSLSAAGLPVALEDMVAALRAHGIGAWVDAPGVTDLSGAQEALIFRVAHEALRNVAEHSGARRAWCTLRVRDHRAELEIADDGGGFDVREAIAREGDHGLRTLTDLARDAGARLRVRSGAGFGTVLVLEVPGGDAERSASSRRRPTVRSVPAAHGVRAGQDR